MEAVKAPMQGHRHDHAVRGKSAESVGHRAKLEREDGEGQSRAAARIARAERGSAYRFGGESYAAVVSAVFVSMSISFAAVSVSGQASGAAEPAAGDAVGVQTAASTVGLDQVATKDGDTEAAARSYVGAALFVSAQVTYTSSSIALALMQR